MHFSTRAIHSAQPSDPATGALVAPIYQTSTYEQESPGVNLGFWRPNPTLRSSSAQHPSKVLFVGADFRRKGGDLLLEWYKGQRPSALLLGLQHQRLEFTVEPKRVLGRFCRSAFKRGGGPRLPYGNAT